MEDRLERDNGADSRHLLIFLLTLYTFFGHYENEPRVTERIYVAGSCVANIYIAL